MGIGCTTPLYLYVILGFACNEVLHLVPPLALRGLAVPGSEPEENSTVLDEVEAEDDSIKIWWWVVGLTAGTVPCFICCCCCCQTAAPAPKWTAIRLERDDGAVDRRAPLDAAWGEGDRVVPHRPMVARPSATLAYRRPAMDRHNA